jgi:hypothetical protein
MKQDNERTAAGGILHDLDDIRSLLDDSISDDEIPVLEDAVGVVSPLRDADAAADTAGLPLDADELERIPVLDDPIAADEDEDEDEDEAAEPPATVPDWNVAATAAPVSSLVHEFVPPATTTAELLAVEELKLAIRNRIDATLKRWVNETLEREMTLLRARLLEVVHDEVHGYLASRIDRDDVSTRTESGRASSSGKDRASSSGKDRASPSGKDRASFSNRDHVSAPETDDGE